MEYNTTTDEYTNTSRNTLLQRAEKSIPGGVHSPVRRFASLKDKPFFVTKAQGAYVYTTEKKRYLDFCQSFGPLIFGHSPTFIQQELQSALKDGTSYALCDIYSLELSEKILENLPNMDQIRFVNSGTEATMTALRLARGFTGKNKIIKFNGCYHGHSDSLLIKGGSGLAHQQEASSGGVTPGTVQDTLVAELNDLEGVRKLFQDHKDQVAALIMEILPANYGLLPQEEKFLKEVRKLALEHKALFIADEVISGFRFHKKGLDAQYSLNSDLITYGKIIGAGFPMAALAGRREIMECLAPLGPVYQAGTLSGNPMAVRAGLASLKHLTSENYELLHSLTDKALSLWEKWLQEYEGGRFSHYRIQRVGSLFWFYPTFSSSDSSSNSSRPFAFPKSIGEFTDNLNAPYQDLHHTLLQKNIYLSPSPYEVNFMSLAHDDHVLKEMEKSLWDKN